MPAGRSLSTPGAATTERPVGTELVWLAAGALLLTAWWYSAQGRERVDAVARRVCGEIGCQRLDETVVLARVRLVRDAGAIALERVYRFEFSTNGADRCLGEVALLNTRPLWARLRHPDGPLYVDLERAPG